MEKDSYLILAMILGIFGLMLLSFSNSIMSSCAVGVVGIVLLAVAGILFLIYYFPRERNEPISAMNTYLWSRISGVEWRVFYLEQKICELNAKIEHLIALQDQKIEKRIEPVKMEKEEQIPAVGTASAPEMKVEVAQEKTQISVKAQESPTPPPPVFPSGLQRAETPLLTRILSAFEKDRKKIASWEVYLGKRWAQIVGGVFITIGLILLGFYAVLEMSNLQKTFTVLAVGIGMLIAGEIVARKTRYQRYGETLVICGFMNIYVFPLVGIYYNVLQILDVSVILSIIVGANYGFAFFHRNHLMFVEGTLASYIMCATVFNYISVYGYAISQIVTIIIASLLTWSAKNRKLYLFLAFTNIVFTFLASAILNILATGIIITSTISVLMLFRHLTVKISITKTYWLDERNLDTLWYLAYLLLILTPFSSLVFNGTGEKIPYPEIPSALSQLSYALIFMLSCLFMRERKGLNPLVVLCIGYIGFAWFIFVIQHSFISGIGLIVGCIILILSYPDKKLVLLAAIHGVAPMVALNCILSNSPYISFISYGILCFNFILTLFLGVLEECQTDRDLSPYFGLSALFIFIMGLFSNQIDYGACLALSFLGITMFAYFTPEFFGNGKTHPWLKILVIYGAFSANTIFAYTSLMPYFHSLLPVFYFGIFTIATTLVIKEKINFLGLEGLPAVKHIPVFALVSLTIYFADFLNAWLVYLPLAACMVLYLGIGRMLKQGFFLLDMISILILLTGLRLFLSPDVWIFEGVLLCVFVFLIANVMKEKEGKSNNPNAPFMRASTCFALVSFGFLTATPHHIGAFVIGFIMMLFAVYYNEKYSYGFAVLLFGIFALVYLNGWDFDSVLIFSTLIIGVLLTVPQFLSAYLKRTPEIFLFLPCIILGVLIFGVGSFLRGTPLFLAITGVTCGLKFVQLKEKACSWIEVLLFLVIFVIGKIAIETLEALGPGYPNYERVLEFVFEGLCISVCVLFVLAGKNQVYTRKINALTLNYSPFLTAAILLLPLLDVKNILAVAILPVCVAIGAAKYRDFINYIFGYLLFSIIIYYQIVSFGTTWFPDYADSIESTAKIILVGMSVLPLSLADVSRTYMRSKVMMNVNITIANGMFLGVTLYLFGYTSYTTISWILFGACVIFGGILLRSLFTRLLGVMFVLGAGSKALFYDLPSPVVDPFVRIIAFITAGVVFLVLSYIYTKYGTRILK